MWYVYSVISPSEVMKLHWLRASLLTTVLSRGWVNVYYEMWKLWIKSSALIQFHSLWEVLIGWHWWDQLVSMTYTLSWLMLLCHMDCRCNWRRNPCRPWSFSPSFGSDTESSAASTGHKWRGSVSSWWTRTGRWVCRWARLSLCLFVCLSVCL